MFHEYILIILGYPGLIPLAIDEVASGITPGYPRMHSDNLKKNQAMMQCVSQFVGKRGRTNVRVAKFKGD